MKSGQGLESVVKKVWKSFRVMIELLPVQHLTLHIVLQYVDNSCEYVLVVFLFLYQFHFWFVQFVPEVEQHLALKFWECLAVFDVVMMRDLI